MSDESTPPVERRWFHDASAPAPGADAAASGAIAPDDDPIAALQAIVSRLGGDSGGPVASGAPRAGADGPAHRDTDAPAAGDPVVPTWDSFEGWDTPGAPLPDPDGWDRPPEDATSERSPGPPDTAPDGPDASGTAPVAGDGDEAAEPVVAPSTAQEDSALLAEETDTDAATTGAAEPPLPTTPESRASRRRREADANADADGGLRLPKRTLTVIGVAIVFVAIAVAGVLVATARNDNKKSTTSSPSGSSGDDGIGIFGTIDNFDRPDSLTSLGSVAPGRDWQVMQGTWGIIGGEALVTKSADQRNIAVVGLGQPDGAVQVRIATMATGAGVIFRYRGPFNYWAVMSVPSVATYNIVKVVDGKATVVGNTGKQSPMHDGTTLAVRMSGDQIDVIVNGRLLKTIDDAALDDAGKVGMTTAKDDETARFDDFVAALPGGRPLLVPSSTTTASSQSTSSTTNADETTTTRFGETTTTGG